MPLKTVIKQAVIEDCYKTELRMESNFVLPLKDLSPHLGGDIDKASKVLKEAIAMSNLNIEEFVKIQKYRDPDQKENLLNSLTAIAA